MNDVLNQLDSEFKRQIGQAKWLSPINQNILNGRTHYTIIDEEIAVLACRSFSSSELLNQKDEPDIMLYPKCPLCKSQIEILRK